jgi:hypothetical protein
MIIFWIIIGIIATGMLFVLSMCVLARISDIRLQHMIRDMQQHPEKY